VLSLCAALAACGGAPEPLEESPITIPQAFSGGGEVAAESQWWRAFEDPALDEAVDLALAGNLDLLAAWERVRAARAIVARESSARRPRVEARADAGYERSTRTGDTWTAAAGLDASYEVDLWGRIDAAVDAERFRAEATRADYEAATLGVAAEVALAWVRIGAAREQLALVERQIERNLTAERMLEQRFAHGGNRAADVLRQQQLTSGSEEELEVVAARVQLLRHQLGALLGRVPDGAPAGPDSLHALPPLPSTGVPASLIQRRPDVQRALFELEAADRDTAAAAAAHLPRLSLGASIETGGLRADRIFRDWAASVAAGLLAPVFLGGELNAELDRAEAERTARWYAYGQAILRALVEVEDALLQEARAAARVERLVTRVALASETHDRLLSEYANGVIDYLAVLVAFEDVQALERELIDARLAHIEQRIALYRALSGPVTTEGAEPEASSPQRDETQEEES
jgi:NodT family efflux transporter outer membrane factor (OMF) lipoprotein